MVIKRSLRLVSAGVAIGLIASYLLTRFIASQIWGIPARDPWTFGAVACAIVVVALAVSSHSGPPRGQGRSHGGVEVRVDAS